MNDERIDALRDDIVVATDIELVAKVPKITDRYPLTVGDYPSRIEVPK